jgi:GntR family transcriptional regulator, transcriptional repressor for pyruvate dehydrogenase complex
MPSDALANAKAGPFAASFSRIRSSRAFQEIAGQIRAELAAGRLKVGNRLPSERALSEQFGVSRNTLREALRSLEHSGLIQLQKGAAGGAFISERSSEAVITGMMDMYHMGAILPGQLTEARIWLEAIIVREACYRATPASIEELNNNVEEAQAAARSGNFTLRAEKHIEFHRILARMTGNPIMVTVMNGVLDVLTHFVNKIGPQENTYTLPSRRRFMKHLVAGDVPAAVAEMETLLKRLQRSYLARMEEKNVKRVPAVKSTRLARK